MPLENKSVIELVQKFGKQWLESEYQRVLYSFADYSPEPSHVVLLSHGDVLNKVHFKTTLGELSTTVMAFRAYKDCGGLAAMQRFAADIKMTADIYKEAGKPYERTIAAADHMAELASIIESYEKLG